MKTFFYSLIASVFFLVASPVNAQEPTFEPSRFITCEGAGCSACNLVEMANEIIIWLFGIIFLLFAVLMTVAGFGLVTSGGNPSALNAAKDKFTNAMIGLLIVMSAWLIVDTLLKSLLNTGEIEGFGPWAEVKCQVQTEPNEPVPVPGGGGVNPGGTGSTTTATSTSGGSCPIQPLTPLTDPFAIRMEAGDRVIYNNPTLEACVTKFRGMVGGRPTSAYRPQSYQTHLWEIKNRWCGTQGLRNNTSPACSALRAEVAAHVRSHFNDPPEQWVCGEVARSNSTHGSGRGVDISGIAHGSASVREAATQSCLIWRNYQGDPYHYDLMPNTRPGCVCD